MWNKSKYQVNFACGLKTFFGNRYVKLSYVERKGAFHHGSERQYHKIFFQSLEDDKKFESIVQEQELICRRKDLHKFSQLMPDFSLLEEKNTTKRAFEKSNHTGTLKI